MKCFSNKRPPRHIESGLLPLLLLVSLCLTSEASAVDIDAVITVDNAYGFGFGDRNSMSTSSYFGGLRNTKAGEITNGLPTVYNAGDANFGNQFRNIGVGPELYDLNGLPASDYLYLVAWSDAQIYQGAIGSFTIGSQTIGTVDGVGWEVFATGVDRNSQFFNDTLTNSTADVALINSQIGLANANNGSVGTSIGWVDESGLLSDGSLGVGALVFGDDNAGVGPQLPFGHINGIPNSARWMWYNEDPMTITNPFEAGPEGVGGHHEFLIFRIPVEAVVANTPEPTPCMPLILGAVLALRRRRRLDSTA